jgi:hypothetical protein
MSNPKAFGNFIKRGDIIYRTSAYIQWGESEKSIGSCLLLNPGSATLDNNLFELLETTGGANGKIKTEDPTMQQLISFIEKIYDGNNKISGRLYIYNLFNIQNAKSKNAIDQLEELILSGGYDIDGSLASQEELESHPWILLGWGIKREKRWKNLQIIKDRWRELIVDSKTPFFGKVHEMRNDYYHPCPLIPTKRPSMVEDLVSIYRQTFSELKENQKRYTLLKWNGNYGDESKFIVLDNLTGRQSLFKPGKCEELFWFHLDLANDKSVVSWDDFGDESFDELEPIVF